MNFTLFARTALAVCVMALAGAWAASAGAAEFLVVANDNKVVLVDGKVTVVEKPASDVIAVLDISQFPPTVVTEINAPATVLGPPLTVAVTPDQSLALVTGGSQINPKDPTKQAPDNKLTVIDLKASPPKTIATLEAGKGAAGLSINRKGDMALVANRNEGTVSVFSIKGKTVAKTDTVSVGDEKSNPSHAVISPDGATALVTLDGAHKVGILHIKDGKVTVDKRALAAGVRPYGADIAANGRVAAIANLGVSAADNHTVSIVDMQATPIRVVNHITVGQTPEGILFSPDGEYLAVHIMNGSNQSPKSPFYHAGGRLLLYRMDGTTPVLVATAGTGHWGQGIAFSSNGRYIYTQHMVEKNLMAFQWQGGRLEDTGHRVPMKGGSAAMRTAGYSAK
jgi:DNA-binding beta-propeller fold protein YncE